MIWKEGDILIDPSNNRDYNIIAINSKGIIITKDVEFDFINEQLIWTKEEHVKEGWRNKTIEEENKPKVTELTLSEIAEKFGIDVKELRIKE